MLGVNPAPGAACDGDLEPGAPLEATPYKTR
jgi:hypothetical protein